MTGISRYVTFDTGKFDDWCVYIVENNGSKQAPFDEKYFTDLQNISKEYPDGKIYEDFVKIYDLTSSVINPNVLDLINKAQKNIPQ
jgi:hypothetical protein